jgi:hypothetical protein
LDSYLFLLETRTGIYFFLAPIPDCVWTMTASCLGLSLTPQMGCQSLGSTFRSVLLAYCLILSKDRTVLWFLFLFRTCHLLAASQDDPMSLVTKEASGGHLRHTYLDIGR